jgi:flagellar biogenesis protein FliO
MMELDELKQKWAEHDRKLEVNIRLTRQLLSATKMNRARSALQRLAVFLALESVIALVVIIALGSFISDHIAMVRFAVPAAALDLFEIATLIVLIQQIRLALCIDYSKPVAAIQKRLESLRMLHIRHFQWTLLLAPLLWTPLMIVALEGFLRVDAYKTLGAAYLLANLLFGLAIIPLAIWLSKKFGDRMDHSPKIQWLMKELAGYNLNAASDFLATLSEFEEEKPDN